ALHPPLRGERTGRVPVHANRDAARYDDADEIAIDQTSSRRILEPTEATNTTRPRQETKAIDAPANARLLLRSRTRMSGVMLIATDPNTGCPRPTRSRDWP